MSASSPQVLRAIPIAPTAQVVVAVVRNEALRLPYMLAYYRSIGFDAFIFIDNGSTDATREILLSQPDTFVIAHAGSFAASGFGMTWVNGVLNQLCDGRWILCADADEQFIWSGSEHESIRQLTSRLDALGAEGVFAILLDMYSDKRFGEIGYRSGHPFVDSCPLFDRGPYWMIEATLFPHRQLYGGVRARLFRKMRVEFDPPTVSKLPLVRWTRGQSFGLCAHGLMRPVRLAPMRAALLHFKMLDDLAEKCAVEVRRGEHFDGAREYLALGTAIDRSRSRSYFHGEISARYRGPDDLLELGLISATDPFAPFTLTT